MSSMFIYKLCNAHGSRGLQKAKNIIEWFYKKGTRNFAKALLKTQRDDALDTDTLHEFERVLTLHGLPANVDEIVDSTYSEESREVFFILNPSKVKLCINIFIT